MTLGFRCAPCCVLFVALLAINAPADQPLSGTAGVPG
ncbi:MAG: hypothetical protein JWM11_7531, partial [Planctomycetaceae bacterium]|nr:hypothetical protein [Planctomycetaceae bacterium]